MSNHTFISWADKVLIIKKNDTFYKYIGRIISKSTSGKFRVDLKYVIREYERDEFKPLTEGSSYDR